MPIPGDAMKNMFSRGANLIKTFTKDMIYGRTAVAGKYKLSEADIDKIVSASDADIAKVEREVLNANPSFANQNSLEAFMIAKGKTIKEGDELSVKGLDAFYSRYFSHGAGNSQYSKELLIKGGGNGVWEQRLDMLMDIRDMSAAAAVGIVGFKAVQTGVSLLTGDV